MNRSFFAILLLTVASVVAGCGDDETSTSGSGAASGSGAGGSGGIGATGGAGGGPGCGDGVIGAGEDCDGNNLAGATCESEGLGDGTIGCSPTCMLDLSQCGPPPNCGNGMIEGSEICDGTRLGSATCVSEGFDGGDLACDARCMLDTSGCCANACPAEGDTQCSGDTVQTCGAGASCLEWQNTTDCTLTGDICDDSSGDALCVVDCSTFPGTTVTNLAPPDGGSASPTPTLVVTFDGPVDTTAGIIDLGGSTTVLSYDLSTSPSEITFSSGDTVMTIVPTTAFQAGETVMVGWTGLLEATCATAVPSPAWSFSVDTPCVPGQNGVVGTTTTTLTADSIGSEYFVAPDTDPNGWVYYGGTAELRRLPKAGGAVQDVELAAGLTTAHLGYAMVVAGQEIYVVDDSATTTAGRLHRISTDGGSSWTVEDYATFPQMPADDFRGVAYHDSAIYLVTFNASGGQQIWTVPASGVAPQIATLLGTVTGEGNCGGIAVDDLYIYLACGTGERLVRLPLMSAPTLTSELITSAFDMSNVAGALHKDDIDADGIADVLYLHTHIADNWYVCNPASTSPTGNLLLSIPGLNYGMGFDPVGKALYVYHPTGDDVIRIE